MHHGLGEHLLERLDVTAVVIAIPKALLMPNMGSTLRHSPMSTAGGYSRSEAGGGMRRREGLSRRDRMSTPVEYFRHRLAGRVLDLDFHDDSCDADALI